MIRGNTTENELYREKADITLVDGNTTEFRILWAVTATGTCSIRSWVRWFFLGAEGVFNDVL